MSNPAPGRLETVRAFVNTLDIDEAVERLATPADLVAWLGEQGLLGDGAGPERPTATAADLRDAVALREALREHLLGHHGDEIDPRAVEVLDAAARRAKLTLRFTGAETTALVPQAQGVAGALGRLLAIIKAAMDDGTWPRLKACPADSCRWAFYDESRNRSAVWCDMRVCGNRTKVRSFRERHAARAHDS